MHKRILVMLAILLILLPMASGEEYKSGICPDNYGGLAMLGFIGLLLLLLLIFSITLIRIPFFNIIMGIGIVFYSTVFMACHVYIGVAVLFFGIAVIIMDFLIKRK